MPIEIRELVIKATVSDRDAGAEASATPDTISQDQNAEATSDSISQADTTTETISEPIEDGEIEMTDHLYTMDIKGIDGESQVVDFSEDTLDLVDADPAETAGGDTPIISFTFSYKQIDDAGGDDTGLVVPDLALADVEAEDYSGDTLTHEIGHWLG